MIGTSFAEYVFIRISIVLVRHTHLLYAAALLALSLTYGARTWSLPAAWALGALLLAEAAFAALVYRPFLRRLTRPAAHPPPPTPAQRRLAFDRCMGSVPSPEAYLRGWFLGAEMSQIHRDNVREFLLWAFFDLQAETFDEAHDRGVTRELNEYIEIIEKRLHRPLAPGRGSAQSFRLTFDSITTAYRSLAWYCIIGLVDQLTYIYLRMHGFQYYARSTSSTLATFPPRPHELVTTRRSPASTLSYYYQPHHDADREPVVFFHGIGVGLWTYVRFLAEVHAASTRSRGLGIIAIEFLPVSFRLTPAPPDRMDFVRQMTSILDHHRWDTCTVVSHSYGSVLTTHMLSQPSMHARVSGMVLIDPVTIGLHLPDVAFNFTRRLPKRANEWQLWYFASTDPGVALCLGRYFFWRDNIMWKEELLAAAGSRRGHEGQAGAKIAVCLSGQDLIVDTAAVARYLEGTEGVEAVIFPHLDHAQVFDDSANRHRVVQLIRSYSSTA
jgi:pimeloyl-ACP methyl ester carboxylesterase